MSTPQNITGPIAITRNPESLSGWHCSDFTTMAAVLFALSAVGYTGTAGVGSGGTDSNGNPIVIFVLNLYDPQNNQQQALSGDWVVWDESNSTASVISAARFATYYTAPAGS